MKRKGEKSIAVTGVYYVTHATRTFRFVHQACARFLARGTYFSADAHTRTRTRHPRGVRDYERKKEKSENIPWPTSN